MSERLVIGGKLTDLTKPDQLGRLNDLLAQLCAITNNFDAGSFALAWIAGDVAGQVIVSKGVGNAPEWDPSPTLTGATFTGLTANRLVGTGAGKALESVDPATFIAKSGAASPYTVTNGSTDRAYNANSTTTDELADVIYTILADLHTAGVPGF